MKVVSGDDSLLVDISDALSERDRVRFTVHTRTKLPQFAKPVISVVRQHEEFIWLHDCLEDNDQYAGYIIPPPPPRPDFDASREKLQRLGDGEANMTKEEFSKMKQELEAEYLAIFKKTVAMHEMFLQRLAAHEKFREDNNFKIFLEYENELAVRSKSKRERIAGSISNIGKSLSDFVITTSQVAATTSASTSLLSNAHRNSSASATNSRQQQSSNQTSVNTANSHNNSIISEHLQINNGDTSTSDIRDGNSVPVATTSPATGEQSQENNLSINTGDGNNNNQHLANNTTVNRSNSGDDDIDEQYFEKERLFLALYHNSIKETALQADKVTQMQKLVADGHLHIAQQLVKLAGIEVVPIKAPTTTRGTVGGCANDHTSEGLKQLLLHVSDFFEQAKKIQARIASDEDLKLTDTFLYYKRDTVAAQDLLARRLRFMSEYDTATKNLEKARQKGGTQMQYADVIQKQAKENFISISKLAKQELIDYKQRRVASFRKAFSDLVELELKHLRAHSNLIANCLNLCRGLGPIQQQQQQQQQQQLTDAAGKSN